MDLISIIFISVGLAMDAFAVSLTEGLAMKRLSYRHTMKVAFTFGLFQALMPFLGWKIGGIFSEKISQYDYIITTILLLGIGGKMIFDAFEEEKCEKESECAVAGNILLLGIATSIDALAIGFSFSLIPNLNITWAIEIIGAITFAISFAGVILGHKIGAIISYKTEYIGGGILILMGLKSLIGHFI